MHARHRPGHVREALLELHGNGTRVRVAPPGACGWHRQNEVHVGVDSIASKNLEDNVNRHVCSTGSTQVAERVAPPDGVVWRVQVAPPQLIGGSSRTMLIEANLPDLGADRNGSRRNNDFCQHCSRCDMRRKADGEWQNLTTKGSIQEARHKNKTQLKSEDKILNRTPKQKHIRQSR